MILCQTYGDTVTDPQTGISSNIWDDIGTDQAPAYVSDLYVDTPAVGNFSPGIPQCFTGSSGDF